MYTGAQTFVYNGLPSRVIFGTGPLARLRRKPTTRANANPGAGNTRSSGRSYCNCRSNREKVAGLFAEAAMHAPIEITTTASVY